MSNNVRTMHQYYRFQIPITASVIRRRDLCLQHVWKLCVPNWSCQNESTDLPSLLQLQDCTHTHSMIPTEVLMNKYTFDSSVKLHLSLISFLPADPSVHHRQKTVVTDMCYPTEISSLMDFGTQDCSLGKGTTLLEKIQGVALVTAGSVHSDLSWQLKDTELSAWLGG